MSFPHWMRATLVATCVFFTCVAQTLAEDASPRYLRFVDEPPQQRLETSILTFRNADGVTVDLIGAVHIGDADYYEQLNERFKQYDAVLYEMVKPKEMKNVGDRAGKSNSWIAILQRFMKNQLALSYQLDKIDYTAKNFVHADLDAETFAQKQEEQGESMMSMMLSAMMKELARPPQERLKNEAMMEDLLNALQAPDSERQLKIVLAKQFQNMEEQMDMLGGDDSVIIGERNKHALKVLRDEIDAGKKRLAVFYGAGHLEGMEELMTTLMGFKPVGEPEWLRAWDLAETPSTRKAPPPLPSTQPAGVQP